MSTEAEVRRINRRVFLQAAAASAGALAVGGSTVLSGSPALAAKPGAVTRNPLYIPPTVSPSGLTLRAAPASVDLGGGKTSSVWAYNGLLPGPTIRAASGSTAQIDLVNGLSQETITHWHGMIVDHYNDGHPRQAIWPGDSYSYNFPINQRAAMNWYHPHPHMLTGEQVAMGLAGGFILTDEVEANLGLPAGAYEVPLVVRDASFDLAGNMLYKPRSGGFLGDTPLVNGTLNPRLAVDTARYRFRVLNGANSRIFGLALGNGAPFTLIGNDGGLLETAVSVSRVDMANGERVDLIIDFRGMPVGSSVMLRDLRSGWDLLEFAVTRAVNDTGTTPTTLSTITPLSNPVRTRNFSFDGMSKINGKVYDLARIDFQVPLGQTELWRFTTSGNAPHPVHVHGASFQVQTRSGGRGQLYPWERGEGHRPARRPRNRRDLDSIRPVHRHLPDPLPQARTRGHGHDGQLRSPVEHDAAYRADGLVWSSPLYHGTISGALKNALDWLHLLDRRRPPYLTDKVIGLNSTAGGTQGLQAANTMEFVVRALRAWAVPYVVPIAHARDAFDADGRIRDETVAGQLRRSAHARARTSLRRAADLGCCRSDPKHDGAGLWMGGCRWRALEVEE